MSAEQKQNTTGQPRFISVNEFQGIVEPLTLACERLKVLSVQSGKKLVTTPSAFYWCNYCTKYAVCDIHCFLL